MSTDTENPQKNYEKIKKVLSNYTPSTIESIPKGILQQAFITGDTSIFDRFLDRTYALDSPPVVSFKDNIEELLNSEGVE